jgi:hypothetical protein
MPTINKYHKRNNKFKKRTLIGQIWRQEKKPLHLIPFSELNLLICFRNSLTTYFLLSSNYIKLRNCWNTKNSLSKILKAKILNCRFNIPHNINNFLKNKTNFKNLEGKVMNFISSSKKNSVLSQNCTNESRIYSNPQLNPRK